MNECLLVKWIWKMMQEHNELWVKIIKTKYLDDRGFFGSNGTGGSQFWKGLHKVIHLFKWSAVYCVGNGEACRFWEVCWAQQVPLKISYDKVFRMVRDPRCSVVDCWEEGSWVMDFKRCLFLSRI